MEFDPLYAFVFAGLFSPGPNVILLTASGARFGFRKTLPHVAGVAIGVGVIAALTGLGIGVVLAARPEIAFALKIIAAAWILYMAWKLWISTRAARTEGKDRPWTFLEAVLFQWVNPKIWVVALAASTGYASSLPPIAEAIRLATAFSGTNLFVCLFWSFAGSILAVLLNSGPAWRLFMKTMAVLLAITAAMVFL